MRKILTLTILIALTLSGCNEARRASQNISRDADEFRVMRKIVFYNAIQNTVAFEMEGNCSVFFDTAGGKLDVTCKTGKNSYQKHMLGLSDNITPIIEQTKWVEANPYHYKLIIKPESLIPFQNVEIKTSGGDKQHD